MQPVFIINNRDYAQYLAADGLKPSHNDLDADGSGRNLVDGLMYRSRIATKMKYSVTFNRLTDVVMARLLADMSSQYVQVTLLDAKQNAYIQRTYYTSTINEGVQRYVGGHIYYDGVSFDITER